MTDHPAKAAGCTKRQIEVFEQIAINQDFGHHPAILKTLLAKGLITFREENMGRDAFGPITVRRYAVPMAVHWQWCEWASEQPDDPDMPDV